MLLISCYIIHISSSFPINAGFHDDGPVERGNFQETWSKERFEYAKAMAAINSAMTQKRMKSYQPAVFVQRATGLQYPKTSFSYGSQNIDDRVRRQNAPSESGMIMAPQVETEDDLLARGKNKKKNKLDYDYGNKFTSYYPEVTYTPYGPDPSYNNKLSFEDPSTKRYSSTQCWTCHVATGVSDNRDLYDDCIQGGRLEFCELGQNYCQTEERQRNGYIYQLKTGCKQPLACMSNWNNNFKNQTHPECQPGSPEYSVCRQCCGGDDRQCDFQAFSDPSARYTTVEDWDSTQHHGYLTGEATGIVDFDPTTFDRNGTSYNRIHSSNIYSYDPYNKDEGFEQKNEFASQDIETTIEVTTTTGLPTTRYTTMFEYESTVEPSTLVPTTTTYLYNTMVVTADPDNKLAPLANLIQTYYEDSLTGNSTLSVDELQYLIKVLREQAKPIPLDEYEAYQDYQEAYEESLE